MSGAMALRRGLTSEDLKLAAAISMAVDHAATALLDWYVTLDPVLEGDMWLRCVRLGMHAFGRLAFPLFAFTLIEGFVLTKSRTRYLGRILALAVVSELPFDLALMLWGHDLRAGVLMRWEHQNVFFTLALGLATMWALEWLRGQKWCEDTPWRALREACCVATIAAGCAFGILVRCDYTWCGVLSIVLGYLARPMGKRGLQVAAMVVPLLAMGPYEAVALLDVVMCSAYNGEKGRVLGRWFFYLFYPTHLLVLGILRVSLVL